MFTGNGFKNIDGIKIRLTCQYLTEALYFDGICSEDCKTVQCSIGDIPVIETDDAKLKKSGFPCTFALSLNMQEFSNEINVTLKY